MGEKTDHVKRRRHAPEQVIHELREADRLLARAGQSPASPRRWRPRKHVWRWRSQYCGIKVDDAKRLEEFERENARLKRIVADQALDRWAKEIAKGNR
jgi:putative transposase